jgi:hypothetical protein
MFVSKYFSGQINAFAYMGINSENNYWVIGKLMFNWKGCCFLAPSFVVASYLSLLVIIEPNWG